MKTLSVKKLLKEMDNNEECPPYEHDVFWIFVWVAISLFVRSWGNLFDRLTTLWLGTGKRTLNQLILIAIFTFLLVFVLCRVFNVSFYRGRK